MLNRIIDFTLAYRWLVLIGILILLAGGGYALYTIPVEAFPDLTNNQVVVVTDAPSLPPSEVEQLVTYPIERSMLGLPNKDEVRSLSKLGLSMVTVVFDDSVPLYFARQLVSERLQQISSLLPQGVQPVLGLPSTAFGELYQYTLSGPMSPMELKDLHEWVIKGQLRTIPGVSEINAWGGQTKQFQIVVDPLLLQQYGLTLHDLAARIEGNNTNFGGGYIEHASEQYTFLGNGRATTADDFANIVLTAKNGTPVLIPFSMLISFLGMRLFGISANLMSLGAIDFGMIVDGAVVMMENSIHRLELAHGQDPPLESIRRAAYEVVRPMTFAVVIIIAVYRPILFLQGLEGRMFRPMATTVCAALFGSLLLALTMIPMLASFAFRRGAPPKLARGTEQHWMERLNSAYGRALNWSFDHRALTVASAAVILIAALGSLFFIGTEFMPRLDEGSILVETPKMSGVPMTD